MEIIPTIVPASFDDVVAGKNRYAAFSSCLHIDSTDGIFAPNRTWFPMGGEKLPDNASITYEAHLMIENPLSIGLSFARSGARRIIGHVEAFQNAECAREAFDMWQKAGVKEVGVAVLLETPLQELAPYAQIVDFVHVMTIAKIGKQGQKFDERAIDRVRDVHARYPDLVISTDGGETEDTVDDLARAGASRFCIGARLARSKDPAKMYSQLLNATQVA